VAALSLAGGSAFAYGSALSMPGARADPTRRARPAHDAAFINYLIGGDTSGKADYVAFRQALDEQRIRRWRGRPCASAIDVYKTAVPARAGSDVVPSRAEAR
jgi:hypothetical protein